MASAKKYRKMDKKNHPGRGAAFGKKSLGVGIKRLSFYTGSDRQELKKIEKED